MRKSKRLCWLLIAVLLVSCMAAPGEAYAAQDGNSTIAKQDENETTYIDVFYNPVYEGRLDKEEISEANRQIQDLSIGGEVLYGTNQFSTMAEAMAYLRAQMVARANSFTVGVPTSVVVSDMWKTLFYGAMEHYEGCKGYEGDTLYWSWTSVSGSISSSGGYSYYKFNVTYDTTYAQEQQLTAKVNEALESLNLTNKSQYEKVKAIYTYICDHVNYDYTYERHAAYDAMIEGLSVCEGYAMLFYRMALDSGLSARLISGTGNGGAHGWNIVKIGDVYYNLDATWDGQDDQTRSNYFLKNEEDFVNHIREERYDTAEFHQKYPMTKQSWVDTSSYTPALNLNNLSYTFTGMDGKTYSSASNQKNKLLIFYSPVCTYSQSTVKSIANSDITGVDIYALNAKADAESSNASFIQNYGSSKINFMQSCNETTNNYAMWEYVWESGWSGSIYYPVIVYIDVNNKLQLVTNGKQTAGDIKSKLEYYCSAKLPALKIESQPATVTVNQNSNATFSVKASGSNLTYQWQYKMANDNTWYNSGMAGAKTASITVEGKTSRNGYQYRCVVKDGGGNTVISNGATLYVKTLVSITGQPVSQTVESGQSATFKVTASGSDLTYQWQYKMANDNTWYNSGMPGAKTANISVEGKFSRNGYQYRCVVKDGSGNKVISNAATLTVKKSSITITGQPSSQTVESGQSATFKVTASGSNLTYQWQYKLPNDSAWYNSGMIGAKTASITVEGKSSRNGYQYRCNITTGSGNKVTSNAATLTVKSSSLSVTGQPVSQMVKSGQSATFKVTASGNNLTYQWQYKMANDNTWYNSGMTGAKTASISVEGKSSRNGYQYRCVIKDGSGNKVTSNAATLSVKDTVITITGQPISQNVEVGKNANFMVTATGTNLTYQWQYKLPNDDTWYNSGMTGAKTSSITVEGKASRNGYQYRCFIKDGSANTVISNAVTLTVK